MRTLNHTGDEAHQPGARPGLAGTLCPPLLEGPDGDRPEVSCLDGCATSERVLLIRGPGVCISPNTGTENGGVAPGAASRGERSGPRPCHPPSLRGALSPTPVAASGTCAGPPNPSSSENSDDRSLPIGGGRISLCSSHCARGHTVTTKVSCPLLAPSRGIGTPLYLTSSVPSPHPVPPDFSAHKSLTLKDRGPAHTSRVIREDRP